MKRLSIYLLFTVLLLSSCHSREEDVIGTGSFEAEEVLVSAQVSAEVLSWHVREGSHFSQGQIVGSLDSLQLYLQKLSLQKSSRGVRASTPDVSKQTAALERRIRELENERIRTEKLLKADVATQRQYDEITASLDVLRSQLAAQSSALNKSQVQLNAQSSSLDIQVAQLEDRIEKCKIKSPIDGVVLENFIRRGELAVAGRPLFRIANIDTLDLRAYVIASNLHEIRLNDSLRVYVDDGEGRMRSYPGQVSWISDKSEFTPKSVQSKSERDNMVYAIKLRVPNDGFLRIGMYGEVRKK